jgi:hypothetical protein
MPTIKWNVFPLSVPPIKDRLLLIFSASGAPPTKELLGMSEAQVGYWTGNCFRSMSDGDYVIPEVTHWALLSPHIPEDVSLRPERRLDPDVRG